MSNVRKTWKTLSAVPDPFEAGVVYVTQELSGHYLTHPVLENSEEETTVWVPLGRDYNVFPGRNDLRDLYGSLEKEPITRVQRCRLHANGRLENTDVAPKDINDTHKITVNPTDIQTLSKLIARERNWSHTHWGMTPGDELVVKTEDGKVLDAYVEPEKKWLSDEIPVPPIQALGLLHQWVKTPGAQVSVLGYATSSDIRSKFLNLLLKHGKLEIVNYRVTGSGPIKIQGPDKTKKPIQLNFYGSGRPEDLRGWNTHYFIVDERVVNSSHCLPKDDTGLDALDNLRLSVRLGDNPDGIVIDKF